MDNNVDYKRLSIFGIRHLSPAGSFHVLKYLDEKKPKCVLIEGPQDGTYIMDFFKNKLIKLPVAVLAYTTEIPVNTLLYPFSEYSPEYRAIRWAQDNKKEARFIDLPSNKSLYLYSKRQNEENEESPQKKSYYDLHNDIYKNLAIKSGEEDYETYWERNFEHNLNKDSYLKGIDLQSSTIREMVSSLEEEALPISYAYNHIREMYMKSQIEKAVLDGFKQEEIVVICGAYHILGLRSDMDPMSEEEFDDIPSLKTRLTLMPYSNYRLSNSSGYGAGNLAPAYFQMMYEYMTKGRIADLSYSYLSHLGRFMRESGNITSTANVIESVRLAEALASLHGGSQPSLKDLHDAAVSCMGHGEVSEVAEGFARLDIGTEIGYLPEGVSQTPVQDDMARELKRLKLDKYKSIVLKELDLDLRENRRVKTKEAAFLDLERSTFFYRLRLLNIEFAQQVTLSQDSATWAERWNLRWSPEVEIEIVEANLKGETIEVAASYSLKEKLDEAKDVLASAKYIRSAYECKLMESLNDALKSLQKMATDSGSFVDIALSAHELFILIKYGDIRQIDTACLNPLLKQLFLRAALLLVDAANCADSAVKQHIEAINAMYQISDEMYELIDYEIWLSSLKELAKRDDRNPKLSGLAFSILIEKRELSEEECSNEISRRFSSSIPSDIAAGWFEGLSMRNRYALLSRQFLWRELDKYVTDLSEEDFYRSVVLLRRAFSNFESREKNSLAELLGEIWGADSLDVSEMVQKDLSEEEENVLSELNDFDFGDLL
ncbi:MAG: DUF5682 family protein [Oscillospiraceae bacterium]|nr:DUF5682 family protein [Oscillospiraceae bacterium]